MNDEDRDLLATTRELLAAGDIHGSLEALDRLLAVRPPLTPKQRFDNARITLREKIQKALSDSVEIIAAAWKEGEYDGSQSALDEAIESECSFSDIDDAMEYLAWTKNEGAYFFHNGGAGGDKDGIDWCLLAYYAQREDLVERLDDEGIELHRRPPRDDEFWCPECEDVQDKEHRQDGKCKNCYALDGHVLCVECEQWVDSAEADAEERCKRCAPPEDEGEDSAEVA